MRRHVIAPAARFLQVPNELIRDPRLSAAAVRLLTWQLSYPDTSHEPLAQTARKACLGKGVFQRAKKELKAAGYLHEWRRQSEDGRWCTYQFVSSAPLADEAACVAWRGADPELRLANNRGQRACSEPATRFPAAGRPTGRTVGRQPLQDSVENTTDPPSPSPSLPSSGSESLPGAQPGIGLEAGQEAGPEADSEPAAPAPETPVPAAPEPDPAMLDAAVTLLLGLRRSEPRLAMSARKARSWAPSAAKWLERGMSPGEIHRTLALGMDTVRSPLGVLDWRLRHALPAVVPEQAALPRPEPRVAHMRECVGDHTQPRLFTPGSGTDEDARCPECRQPRTDSAPEAATEPPSDSSAEPSAAAAAPQGSGFAGYRAARNASRRVGKTRTTLMKGAQGAYGANNTKRSSNGSPVVQKATR